MSYVMMKYGRRACISRNKNRYLFIEKKKRISDMECIGGVQLDELKNTPEEATLLTGNTSAIAHLALMEYELAAYPIYELDKCHGKICGYMVVEHSLGEKKRYVAIYTKRRLVFPLLISLYGAYILALPVMVLAIASLAYFIVSNRPRDMPQAVTELQVAEGITEYDDSPIPIEPDTATMDNLETGGYAYFNTYSGTYTLGTGEAFPLTNLSDNTVYLRYILQDSDKTVFTSDLIAPGTQYDFIPSDYLQKGKTNLTMRVECYAMDKITNYPGGCLFDICINYQ